MGYGVLLLLLVAVVQASPSEGLWLWRALRTLGAGAPPPPPLPPREVPLPYALQDKPHPRGYVALRAPRSPSLVIDGRLDEAAWRAAPWTEPFLDIVGPTGPAPWAPARVKMLWDDKALYIGALMEGDRELFANETLHDSIVYHDTDFEVFIDPDGDNIMYYEIEVNGAGAVWDLLLARPYRNGGPAIMNWETVPPGIPTQQEGPTGWSPMRHAVWVDGEINSPRGTRAWGLEMALPWSLLRQAAGRRVPPKAGDAWRINFSNVMWTVKWDPRLNKYVKDPPNQEPYNFVWSPQYQVAMHQPETWGYVQFEDKEAVAGVNPPTFEPDPTWPARAYLMELYTAQHSHWGRTGAFAATVEALGMGPPENATAVRNVRIEVTQVSFVASADVPMPPTTRSTTAPCTARRAVAGGWAAADRPARLYITADGRLSLTFPGGDGSLGYRPAEGGGSRWC